MPLKFPGLIKKVCFHPHSFMPSNSDIHRQACLRTLLHPGGELSKTH